jgi:6-phosphogluconate dehydrogenase
MNLLRLASASYGWDLDLGTIASIWRGGCIIRAQFLDKIKQAYQRRADLPNLLLDPDFKSWVEAAQPNWRLAVTTAMQHGVPCITTLSGGAAVASGIAALQRNKVDVLALQEYHEAVKDGGQ